MEESKSNASARRGKRRIVATGVGGIAGIMILGGAFAVASIIRNKSTKGLPDAGKGNQDIPDSPTQTGSNNNSSSREEGSEGLRSLLETSSPILESPECGEEHDASGITTNNIDAETIEDEASMITAAHIEENDHVPDKVESPIMEDAATEVIIHENVSNSQDLFNYQGSIEDKSSRVTSNAEPDIVETSTVRVISITKVIIDENVSNSQDLFNCKGSIEDESSRVTCTQNDNQYAEPDMVETPKEKCDFVQDDASTIEVIAEEKVSTCEDISSCKSSIEHNITSTQINLCYTEPEPVETQTKVVACDDFVQEDISTNGAVPEDIFTCSSNNTKQDASRTTSDECYPETETVKTPIEENRSLIEVIVEENFSTCEELLSCHSSSEHEASKTTLTQNDDYYPEPEAVETPIKEERWAIVVEVKENNSVVDVEENDSTCEELFTSEENNNEHDASTISPTEHELETVEILPITEGKSGIEVTVQKEITHGSVWASGAIDMIQDGISIAVSKVSLDSDEGSLTCDSVKEDEVDSLSEGAISVVEVGLPSDPQSPLQEEIENEDDEDGGEMSEGTHDSSTESNSEAIWPVESTEEELLVLKDRAQVKILEETGQNVEESEFVTMKTGMELRGHPSKILVRGGFLVWLLLVVGLVFVLFASDLPLSYHLNDPQLSSKFQK